jgi:hypothetical protein
LECSLRSLEIGLRINDPLKMGNAWCYVTDVYNEISRGFYHDLELVEKIISPPKPLALEQNKLLDDLCRELFGVVPSKSGRHLRIYQKS